MISDQSQQDSPGIYGWSQCQLKFHRYDQRNREELELLKLIDIGSCFFYSIHGAF